MNETKTGFAHNARQAVLVTLALLLLCGFLFPVVLTGISAVVFPWQAGGSLITVDGKPVAAEHVGQQFVEDYYLWGRPSAYQYNVYVEDAAGNQFYRDGSDFAGVSSGSNNYGASNPALTERVAADMAAFLAKNPTVKQEDLPADVVTASGSGLDPHISPDAAEVQVARIAEASSLGEDQVRQIIADNTNGRLLGVFGEPTVNVVKVNVAIGTAMGLLSAGN